MKHTRILAFLALLLAFACTQENLTPVSDDANTIELRSTSNEGVTPVIIPGSNNGGNRTCAEVINYFGCDFDYSSGRVNCEGCTGGTAGPITWTYDEATKTVSWTSSVPVKVAFIVKGSNDANVYVYGCGEEEACATGDSGLTAPGTGNNQIAGLSNLTICWTECGEGGDCAEETAYGGNTPGGGPAWWYTFNNTQVDNCQSIYAGQQLMEGGSVCYDASSDVLTITLGPGWVLQASANKNEPVKVQGYNSLPNRRPASGRFTTYKGDELVVQGDNSPYYVIHLDVAYCPE
jgi:hypothetical protein